MTDELLPYYQKELAFIRRLGAEFAEANPKIAGRLRMTAEGSEDPHVSRLIEAFAYLNARTRHKLEDDFPEITDAMLGVLYPHYQVPIPSMAIVQCVLDRTQGELTTGYRIPRHTMIESEPIDGEPCRFQTAYPIELWPIELVAAGLHGRPFQAPSTPFSTRAQAVVQLSLQSLNKSVAVRDLELDKLRFFLRGQSQHVLALYELLMNNVLEIAVAGSASERRPVVLDRQCLRPVGFARDEGMLPYQARSFLGYRLLSEYFAFPEKFLFIDLTGLDRRARAALGERMEIFIYLNRSSADLEHNVSEDTFRLGCTPVVNLFRQRAEPIQLTQTEFEYHVIPDARRPLAHEVYSVDRVSATTPDGEQVAFQPFYSFKHGSAVRGERTFWFATRRPANHAEGQIDPGTEIFLSLVDLGFDPSVPGDWTLDVETTCTNRDLPNRLPFGGDQPRLYVGGGAPLSRVACLTPPTRTLRPSLKHGAMWRLVSHLSLNHLSLEGDAAGVDALREILKLYNFNDSAETQARIDGLLELTSRRVVGRAGGAVAGGFCRGIEVTLQFDEAAYSDHGLYLFASVLEVFLGLYCSINSFTRLVATTRQREGVLRRWPARAGEKVLL